MDEQNYILESEKKVLDIIGLQESLPRREINAVGIIGAGTMGGVVELFFQYGLFTYFFYRDCCTK